MKHRLCIRGNVLPASRRLGLPTTNCEYHRDDDNNSVALVIIDPANWY